jgi:hypothetical protein
MYKFYFNDCLPHDRSKHEIVSCFEKTLPEYKVIRLKYDVVDGIVTLKMPESIVLNEDGFTLKNCIEGLADRNLKRYAFAVFGKYPVEGHFLVRNENDLLENKYCVTINDIDYDALNIKLVQENTGFLFSMALHDDIKRDAILIKDKNDNEYFVANLYGEAENTVCIDRKIQELIAVQRSSFERLLQAAGKCCYNAQFKDAFNKLSESIQIAIIDCFRKARERKGLTPFYADGKLIKDVTPEKEQGIKIHELRIFSPVAYRLYFYEATDAVYLGTLEKKSAKKVQSNQIKTAAGIIKNLAVR